MRDDTLTLTGNPGGCSQRALPEFLGGHLGQRLSMDMGSRVYGTFNVYVPQEAGPQLAAWSRTRVVYGQEPTAGDRRFDIDLYLCEVSRNGTSRAGWVVVDSRTGLSRKDDRYMLSIASREPFPTDLMDGPVKVSLFRSWGPTQRTAWCKDKTWFQTFGWSPRIRANSALVWGVIRNAVPMSGRTLLDIGCATGYHTIHAAKDGALATGVDVSEGLIDEARIIARHIEMSDANFAMMRSEEPAHPYDVILYLSVAQYESKDYSLLKARLRELKTHCHDLLVEVITPPLKGTMTPNRLERIIGGERLLAYEHRLHGQRERRLYLVRGIA